jgi:hypothetical protein
MEFIGVEESVSAMAQSLVDLAWADQNLLGSGLRCTAWARCGVPASAQWEVSGSFLDAQRFDAQVQKVTHSDK